MANVQIHAPDGSLGTVPEENLQAAIAAGGYLPGQAPEGPGHPGAPEETGAQLGQEGAPAAKGFALPVLLTDKATGQSGPVEAWKVKQALLAGTHEVAQPDEMVRMTAPDGTLGEVPAKNLTEALRAGGELSSSGQLERQGIQAESREPGVGNVLLGLGGAAQPLVDAAARATGIESPEDMQRIETARGAAREANPGSYWAGRIPGEIATAAGLGAVGDVAAGALKFTGYAKAALQGAIFGAPEAAAALVNKDPGGAAEALAWGVAGNVGLHAAFGLGSRILAPVAKTGIEEASKVVADATGLPAETVGKLAENFAPLAKEAGFVEADFKNPRAFMEKARSAVESDTLAKKAYETLDRVPMSSDVLQGALRKSVDEMAELPEHGGVKAIAEKLSDLDRKPDLSWSDARDLRKWLREPIEEAAEKKASTVARTGAEVGEWLQAHPDLASDALANPAKYPDMLNKVASKAPLGEGVGKLDRLRAVEDAKDIVHANLMAAQDALVDKLGTKAGAGVIDGLKRENAAYAVERVFGNLEKIKVPERRPGAFKDVGILSFRHNPLLMAMHLFGGHAGVTVPLHAGILAFKVARNAVRAGAETRAFGEAVRTLRGTSAPNTSMALEALKSLDAHIGTESKALLSSLVSREKFTHASAVDSSIGRFLPNGGNGQSREAQVSTLRNAVNLHQDNPGAVSDHLAAMTAPLHSEGLTPVAMAYSQHQLRLMKVIQTALPQDTQAAHPFASDVHAEEISPAARARYERVLTIASNPTKLLGFVKANTITPTDVAIAAATNPATLQKLRMALVEEAVKTKPDLSYQQRLSMSVLMGENLEASTATVPQIQASFAPTAPPAIGGKNGVQNKGMNAKGQDDALESHLTVSQRSVVAMQ